MVMYAGPPGRDRARPTRSSTRRRHPYTLGLLASPAPARRRRRRAAACRSPGTPPSLIRRPPGCAFHPRCRFARVPGRVRTEWCPSCGSSPAPARAVGRRCADGPMARPSPTGACRRGGRGRPCRRRRRRGDRDVVEPTRCADDRDRDRRGDRPTRRRRPATGATATPLLVADGPGQGLPDPRRRARPHRGRRVRPSPASTSTVRPGRDARPRGRVGLRQVDHRPAAAATSSRPTAGHGALRRRDDQPRCRASELAAMRRRFQIVFQDPYASLNPRMTVGRHRSPSRCKVHLGLKDAEADDRVAELLRIGRPRRPSTPTASRTSSPAASASGSASPGPSRSSPTLIVLDEPVSALDVSIQAGVVNLLQRAAGRARAWPTCSSPTTCRWCATSPTGWP